MENKELNVTWCFPDLLNLHGDRGNIMALEKVGKMLGIDVKVNKVINLEDEIDFEKSDILFFNPGELKLIKPIVEALDSQKSKLSKYIEDNKVVVAIGTSGAIFGKEVRRLDETFSGLGYLDMYCTEREMVYGDDIIYKLSQDENVEINGSQIQIIDTTLNSDIAFGKIIYGHGNNGSEDKSEGARYNNLIFTNCLGPVLVKNPWLAEQIIKYALSSKGISIDSETDKSVYDLELKSMECIKIYNENKNNK